MSHLLLWRFAAALGLAALVQGCDPNVSVDPSATEPLAQGIFGTVTRSTGDFMCCPVTGKIARIAVPVHIIRGRIVYESGKSPPPLADLPLEISVQSGADGMYGAGLTPGTYTAFAEIDGELYLNDYSTAPPQETYNFTEVVAGAFAKADIDDNSGASY
jgi:hypothetical protein